MRIFFIALLFSLMLPSCGEQETGVIKKSDQIARAVDKQLIEDLVALSEGGLGDVVLLAKIKIYNQVIPLSSADMISLKKRGLSDRVIKRLITGFDE